MNDLFVNAYKLTLILRLYAGLVHMFTKYASPIKVPFIINTFITLSIQTTRKDFDYTQGNLDAHYRHQSLLSYTIHAG